jgi:hypothetical protein
MEKTSTPRWTKPELVRLGKIADVAGAQNPVAQSAGNVKS